MRNASESVLQAENITKSYGGRTIIRNISLTQVGS